MFATPLAPQNHGEDTSRFVMDLKSVDALPSGPRAEGPASSGASAATVAPLRPELSPQGMRQIAEWVSTSPNRPVEITLSPEELGRLRLTLSLSEVGVTVHLAAERPETMDLVRRHIDQLGQEFLSLGFENIAFAFDGQESAQGEETTDHFEGAVPEEEPDALPSPLRSAASSGLDLRL
ncbi:MAG: flagellar hook-length control protein FliK [Pseudomonadota bacterium]